jgi:hypothetical protein
MRQNDSLQGLHYHLRTFGCQMNLHDSERVAGMLEALGALEAARAEDADIVVFMTCCVREAADVRLKGQVASLKNLPYRAAAAAEAAGAAGTAEAVRAAGTAEVGAAAPAVLTPATQAASASAAPTTPAPLAVPAQFPDVPTRGSTDQAAPWAWASVAARPST